MLVRLADDDATVIVPVARISAVTTGEKIGGRRSVKNAVVSMTQLQVPLSGMSKLTSTRIPL